MLVCAVGILVIAVGWLTTQISAKAATSPGTSGTGASNYTVVFKDDFSGASNTGLNRSNWPYATGTSYPGGAGNWGTGEVERMTDSTTNVFQDGHGHLAIKPVRDEAGNWTSGRIETQRTDFAAPPGGKLRVEASLQQPDVSGAAAAGYWPAFWMLADAARPVGATNWPGVGEWDIMENINGRGSEFATLHCGFAPGGPCNEFTGLSSGEKTCPSCQTSFHTYAVEYDRSAIPETLRWYLDGTNFFTLRQDKVDTKTWDSATHHGFFIILNVAIGGAFPAAFGGGPTGATQSGAPMLVDYVAVATSGGGATTPEPTDSPSAAPPSTPAPPAVPPSTTPPPSAGIRDAYAAIQAESADAQAGTHVETTGDNGAVQDVADIANGAWLRYDSVDFGSGAANQFNACVASGAEAGVSGLVEVRLDSPTSPSVSTFATGSTGGRHNWRTVPANMAAVTGTHTVYLTFTSDHPAAFVNVDWFTFTR